LIRLKKIKLEKDKNDEEKYNIIAFSSFYPAAGTVLNYRPFVIKVESEIDTYKKILHKIYNKGFISNDEINSVITITK